MTASAIGAVLAARTGTGQPVWRKSYDEEDARAQVTWPMDGGQKQALRFIDCFVRTMKQYAQLTKADGRAHGMTQNAIWVAEVLLRRCTDFATGRCTPCLETIMRLTGFARPTVVRLLASLRGFGFLDWVRRTVRTGNRPGEGPQVRQTSNAYFVDFTRLPRGAYQTLKAMLGKTVNIDRAPRHAGSGPVPDRVQRLTTRLAKSLTGRQESGFAARARAIDGTTLDRRAERMWPGDAEAQAFFNEAMGVRSASSDTSLECPLPNRREAE